GHHENAVTGNVAEIDRPVGVDRGPLEKANGRRGRGADTRGHQIGRQRNDRQVLFVLSLHGSQMSRREQQRERHAKERQLHLRVSAKSPKDGGGHREGCSLCPPWSASAVSRAGFSTLPSSPSRSGRRRPSS